MSARRERTLTGVGIGLRRAFHETLVQTERELDWLEIVAENFMGLGGRPRDVLEACAERWPIVAHGVALSVGGPDAMDAHLDALLPLLDRIDPPFFTDHLCYSSLGGRQTFDLLPLPFHLEAVKHVARRVRRARARVERPIVLENITYYAEMPGSDMAEAAFVRAVLEEADCGLLLDLNNLYVNAVNHGRDPDEQLALVPFERVRQIHLAGFTRENGVLLDTHSRRVSDAVWSLYRETIARAGPIPTLIEWDQSIPSLDAVLDEADRARAIQREMCSPRVEAV